MPKWMTCSPEGLASTVLQCWHQSKSLPEMSQRMTKSEFKNCKISFLGEEIINKLDM